MEQQALNTLLDRGVYIGVIKTPLLAKIRGCWHFKVVIRKPTLAQLYRMSGIILSMGLTSERLQRINLIDSYNLLDGNAYKACQAIAIVCEWKNPLLSEEHVSQILYKGLTGRDFQKIWQLVLLHSGVVNFTNTIRYIVPKMGIYLSPRIKGS